MSSMDAASGGCGGATPNAVGVEEHTVVDDVVEDGVQDSVQDGVGKGHTIDVQDGGERGLRRRGDGLRCAGSGADVPTRRRRERGEQHVACAGLAGGRVVRGVDFGGEGGCDGGWSSGGGSDDVAHMSGALCVRCASSCDGAQ